MMYIIKKQKNWVNYNDLTVLPNPGIMVNKGNHPQMAQEFRFVKYYFIYPDISPSNQCEFQDPKMEVLYHMFGHILGGYSLKFRSYICLIYGRYLQFRLPIRK
jgi:hypothetical protein